MYLRLQVVPTKMLSEASGDLLARIFEMPGHLYLKVLLSCRLLDSFLSQKAPEAPREPAVISVSASPVRVNHPIQNGS